MSSTINASTASGGGVITSADASGILQLQTAGTTAVTIDASQNVGIGTSSPAAKLDVAATIRSTANVTPTSGSGLEIIGGSSSNFIVAYNRTTPAFLPLELQSSIFTVATAGSERMRINSSGNVGIGTSSPGVKLDVTGSQYIRWGNFDALTINGSSTNSVGLRIQNTVASGRNWNIGSSGGGVGAAGSFFIFDDTAGAGRLIIDSSGNLLVGTTSAYGTSSAGNTHIAGGTAQQLFLRHTAATAGKYWKLGPDNGSNNMTVMNNSGAGVYMTDGANTWSSTSDERLKTDLIPIENGLEKVNSLRSVTGRFKTDEEGVSRSFLIAQDVQAVLPEAVSVQDDELGTLGVAYTEVIPLLVASIKELKAIIDAQQEQIDKLGVK